MVFKRDSGHYFCDSRSHLSRYTSGGSTKPGACFEAGGSRKTEWRNIVADDGLRSPVQSFF